MPESRVVVCIVMGPKVEVYLKSPSGRTRTRCQKRSSHTGHDEGVDRISPRPVWSSPRPLTAIDTRAAHQPASGLVRCEGVPNTGGEHCGGSCCAEVVLIATASGFRSVKGQGWADDCRADQSDA